ncbi:MAG: hypothetical protein WCO00_07405 [Rhodospirillaceae bacterium]
MPTVTQPAPAGAAPAVTASGVATALPIGEVGLERLPERLSQLSRPVVITGTVIGQTDDGATRVRTQAGDVVLRTATPLAADAPVALKITPGQPPTSATAFLITQPGATPGGSPAAATLAGLPLTAGAGEAALPAPAGATARPAMMAAEATVPPPPPGTLVPGQVLAGAGRTPARQPSAAAPQGSPQAPGAALAAAQPQSLVPGTTLGVRILGPSAGVAGPELAEPGGLVLTGTVAGRTGGGQTVLVTPQGCLALTLRGPLPQGMTLTVELVDPRQLVFEHPEPAGASEATPWPTLSESVASLGGLEGALVQSLLGTVVPQPNRRLAAALSFFLDAIRHGDARGWLGEDATAALDSGGRGDLLSRLTDEFRAMARDAAQTPPGEWRPLAIPLFDGTGFQRVELYVKAQREDDEAGGGGKGGGERSHRFVLDLDLSRFGALQLDGLVKSRSRRFDLILRSHQPLPDPLRSELLSAFSASLEAVGFAGGLAFQPGARGWIKPPPPRRPGPGVVA